MVELQFWSTTQKLRCYRNRSKLNVIQIESSLDIIKKNLQSSNNSIIYESPVTYVPTTAPFDMMRFSEASTIEGTEFKLDWYNTELPAQVAWIEIDYTGIFLTRTLSGS